MAWTSLGAMKPVDMTPPPLLFKDCLVSFLVSWPWWAAYDFISEDDVDLQTKIMNCNVWWFIAAACLLVGVVGLVVINILHHKDREPDYSVSLHFIYTYTLEMRIFISEKIKLFWTSRHISIIISMQVQSSAYTIEDR